MPPDALVSDGAVPAADVRAALGRVLRSTPFAKSPQLQRFLTFLVDEALAGRGDRLKEYVIGLEVFARPSSYDPRVDSLVRVEARRLRAALSAYYAAEGLHDGVVIDLQRGGYVPAFRVSAAGQLAALGPQATVRLMEDAGESPAGERKHRRAASQRVVTALLVVGAVAVAALGVSRLWRTKPVQALAERDLVVLAGFDNATGDAVFEETLKQGLATDLEQSPFLNIVSERRVEQVLTLMGRTGSDTLAPGQARDLCVRAGAKAVIAGSIHMLGSQYVVGLTATGCDGGENLVHVQAQAARKEDVLGALSDAARALRGRLGESLASIQQFGVPVEDATTSSLEALQAYSLGRRTAREKGSPADRPFYERALELDADFAAAHAALGVSYINQGQRGTGGEHLKRAYDLRERVSERERYRIAAYYHQAVTGDLEKAGEIYELWKRSYPREFAPLVNLGLARLWLGQYEAALADTMAAQRLEPGDVLPNTNLAALLIKLGRTPEARAVLEEARARNLTSTFLRLNLCYIAFLEADPSVIDRELASVRGRPGEEAPLLSLHADTEAYHGRLRRARELSRQAGEAALQGGGPEAAAVMVLNAALREAEFGNRATARAMVSEALALAGGRDVITLSALASARAGDVERAGTLADRLIASEPFNTTVNRYWVPAIRAAIELRQGRAAQAIARLQVVSPYELGSPPPLGLATLYPVYLRGEALLGVGDGVAAAEEFQRILENPGLLLNFPLHALSRLQLARALRLSGDRQAALQSYEAFLALWLEADPDVPVLRAAKSEVRLLR